jgi:hypothetical protein
MQEPGYPSAQGQPFPQLDLAMYALHPAPTNMPEINPATSMPPQNTATPSLDGDAMDLMCMGINPEVPYYDPNVAGMCEPVPAPSTLMKAYDPAYSSATIDPTFTAPDTSVPSLKPGDVVFGAVDYVAPLAPDPHLGDLLQFDRPFGLNIVVSTVDPLAPDPAMPDTTAYDRPAGLEMPNPLQPDPALPDLQNPETKQEVYMDDRPADLAHDALSVFHLGPGYASIDGSYPEQQFDQDGDNSRRARHLTPMLRGLDAVR